MMRVPVTGRPAAWQVFFTEFHLVDADGNKVGVIQNNEYQARYVIYAARAGEFMVEVPAEPVAAGKAVQGYEQYLREVAKELLEQALQMTKDYKQAERITREILESFDLPKLAVETALAG
jgi:thioredoxin reductase